MGSLDKTKKNVGTGLVGAPACGDVMKLQIELTEDGQTIEKAVFKVWLNYNIEEALKIKNSDIASYLKLPPVKLHCSMLAEEAIKKAIEDVKAKSDSPQTSSQTV